VSENVQDERSGDDELEHVDQEMANGYIGGGGGDEGE